MNIRIPIPNGSFSNIQLDIASADVPFLQGLDVLDREIMVANNVTNELNSPLLGWSMPLERKFGHLYLCWSSKEVLFTKRELVKFRRHFHRHSSGKLYELIKRAKQSQADESPRKLLQEILRSCETCQTFSAPPQLFRFSLPPSDALFNREVAMYPTWIGKKALQHVLDLEIKFSSAIFLPNKIVEGAWDALFRAEDHCTLDFS